LYGSVSFCYGGLPKALKHQSMALFAYQNTLGNKEFTHHLYPSPYKSNHTPRHHYKKLSISSHFHRIHTFQENEDQNA
jgi:hypothetical protein